jgi:hypothetical protein
MAPASKASVTWRAIEYGIELLKHGVIHTIGDGQEQEFGEIIGFCALLT